MTKINQGLMDDHNKPQKYTCKEGIERLRQSNFDMKKIMSIIHGYMSLIELDCQEGTLSAEQLNFYAQELGSMFEKSYMYWDGISEILDNIVCDDE